MTEGTTANATTPATNLRRVATALVGRDRELADIDALLADAVLVTLTGSGGVGKTRLAHAVMEQMVTHASTDAWWVDLAVVADPTRVPSAVAAAVGAPEQPGVPAHDSLLAWLAPRAALVVLDNCEHLVDTVADLANAIIEHCRNVRIIATSREPLGVPAEVTWRTPSLAVPPPGLPTLGAVAEYPGVSLFTERARAARPGFEFTDDDAAAIAEIVQRLDGVPLAIELAAARVRTMGLEQLRASLDDRFRSLTGGARTAVPRQRTLAASVAWSYDLLDAPEQHLFRRIGVFAGRFEASAAAAVCGDDLVPAGDVPVVLSSLVDRSLVEVADDGRYRLLETLRHFARDEATRAGEIDVWRDRHLTWCRSVAPAFRLGPHLDAARFRQGVGLLDDLRQALTWALAGNEVHAALVVTIADLLEHQARHDDVRALGRLLDDAFDRSSPRWVTAMASLRNAPKLAGDVQTLGNQREALQRAADPLERSRLLLALSQVGSHEGELAIQEACELTAAAGSPTDEIMSTFALAAGLNTSGRLREARPLVERLRRHTATDGPRAWTVALAEAWVVADTSIPAAVCVLRRGAEQLVEDSGGRALLAVLAMWGRDTALADEIRRGDRWVGSGSGPLAAYIRLARAIHALLTDDLDAAATVLRPNPDLLLCLFDADVALRQGDRRYAEDVIDRAAVALDGMNVPLLQNRVCVLRAGLALADSDVRAAHELAQQALSLGVENDNAALVVNGLEAVAIALSHLGRGDLAARLAGAADAQRGRSGYRWRLAPLDAAVPGILSDERLHDAVAAGRTLSLDEAVAQAVRDRSTRRRATHGWDALTPAEQQATMLVGEGCTNRQIADRLVVSVATVKTHLVHAYDKLGIHSRTELAAQVARRAERRRQPGDRHVHGPEDQPVG